MTRPIVTEVLPPDVANWLDDPYSMPVQRIHGAWETVVAIFALIGMWWVCWQCGATVLAAVRWVL